MQALRGELLLLAWETGMSQHDLERALTLLALSSGDRASRDFAALPMARRNRLLLELHARTFGPLVSGLSVCSRCGAQMEFAVRVEDVLSQTEAVEAKESMEWCLDGRDVQLRSVNTLDLLASLQEPDLAEAQNLVLRRCLTLPDDSSKAASAEVLASAAQKFDELHAAAETRATIECPACSAVEILDLDIAAFLWLEVRNAALRLLREIHELASAYGWSENSVLRMSTMRRAAYLEMLSA